MSTTPATATRAAVEEGDDSDIRALFETQFFGAVAMIKAALPGMRARRSGAIVNAEPEKCGELAWHDLDNLPPNVIPYVRQALANYRRGVWFDSFGWPDSQEPGR